VQRPGGDITLTLTIDAAVDLPSDKKGSHLSRNVDVISDIVDESVRRPIASLENLSSIIAKRLLEKHEYATFSEVRLSGDYFMEKRLASGKESIESYALLAKARAERGREIKKSIGVVVTGMTACPCAMETTRARYIQEIPESSETLSQIPTITHNQRNVSTLIIEASEGHTIEADDLIHIVEKSLSSPTFGMLKRDDEAQLVMNAHNNPKFVEDVVRSILKNVLDKYRGLPDEIKVTVMSESEESIHKHNAFAERVTTLGELRA
jgi:GTP cyclohydrolase-4